MSFSVLSSMLVLMGSKWIHNLVNRVFHTLYYIVCISIYSADLNHPTFEVGMQGDSHEVTIFAIPLLDEKLSPCGHSRKML